MVLLTMTPSIVEALKTLEKRESPEHRQTDKAESDSSESKEPCLSDPEVGKPISHGQIINLWKQLKEGQEESASTSLEELLRGANIYVPPPPPKPEPTDEFKALMARLRREEEERSYERMTQRAPPRESFAQRFPFAPMAQSFAEVNKPSKASDLGDDDIEFGDVQKQVTLIFNFLVSIIGSGAALWKAAQWWSVSARLFLSLGGALVVAVAEVAVYSAYQWRMAQGSKKEQQSKDNKKIVQTWVVGEQGEKKDEKEPPAVLKEGPDNDNQLRKRFPKAPDTST
ncbi:endoplasmic reticulum-based factor for assembly of V-ATPase-domain-containing protein [Xylariomycetidae sp. FL0641]|nr:endoplasmic reticulum-based factor for assembly of V-ATPase-domain-containing protein [Xylariomycetidae sp. FL0641]